MILSIYSFIVSSLDQCKLHSSHQEISSVEGRLLIVNPNYLNTFNSMVQFDPCTILMPV